MYYNMNSIRCLALECNQLVEYSCECNNSISFMCGFHRDSHSALKQNHKFKQLLKSVNGDQEILLDIIYKQISCFTQIQSSLVENTQAIMITITKSLNAALDKLRKEQENLTNLIKIIKSQNKIMKEDYSRLEKYFFMTPFVNEELFSTIKVKENLQSIFDINFSECIDYRCRDMMYATIPRLSSIRNLTNLDSIPDLSRVKSLLIFGNFFISLSKNQRRVAIWNIDVFRKDYSITNESIATCMAICNDCLFIGAKEGQIYIWNLINNTKISEIAVHTDKITCIVAAGNIIVSGSKDKTIRCWNINNQNKPTILYQHNASVKCVALSEQAKYMATCSNQQNFIWDFNANKKIGAIKNEAGISCMEFLSEEFLIVGGSNGSLIMWNVQDLIPHKIYKNQSSLQIITLKVSPDRSYFISASGDNVIKKWGLTEDMPRSEFTINEPASVLQITQDSKKFICGTLTKSLYLIDINSKSIQHKVAGILCKITSLTVTARSEFLVIGNSLGDIAVWDLATIRQDYILHMHVGSVNSIKTFDQMIISAGADAKIIIWSIQDKTIKCPINIHDKAVRCLTLSSDNSLLISGSDDTSIAIWDIRSQRSLSKLYYHKSPVVCVAITSNKKLIVSGSEDKCIKVWNFDTKLVLFNVQKGTEYPQAIAINDKATVMYFSAGPSVIAWHLKKNKFIHEYKAHLKNITALEITENQRYLISSSIDNKICISEIKKTQRRPEIIITKFSSGISCLFQTKEQIFVGSSDGESCVFDLKLKERKDIIKWVQCIDSKVNFSIVGYCDGTVRLEVNNNSKLILIHKSAVVKVLCEIGYALSRSTDGMIIIWDLRTFEKLKIISDERELAPACAQYPSLRYLVNN